MDALTDGYLESVAFTRLFDAHATLARMLEFEAALAAAESALGLIPCSAALIIGAACEVAHLDLEAIKRATATSGTPAIAMVQQLTALVAAEDADAARYVHWGSTSQDVMDTALVLQMRAGLTLLNEHLTALTATLAELVVTHRGTVMVARTLSQHALPMTFGLKVAGWLDALSAARTQLVRVAASLPVQCGGPAGTLAALGADGARLRDALAARLALVPASPWHSERTIVREAAAQLANLAACAGKVAFDLILMMQSEVGELNEAQAPGRGGSSALPHKRNPVAAIGAYAGARRAPGLLATVFASFEHMHERAAGAWHAESTAVRELFVVTGAAVEQLQAAFADIEVDPVAMRRNLELSKGLIMAEAVARALATSLGRPAAQALVTQAVGMAQDSTRPLADVLAGMPEVMRHIGEDGLRLALVPEHYLGVTETFIEEALARHAQNLQR